MPEKKKPNAFLPKHMREALADCVGLIFDALDDQGDKLENVAEWDDGDDGQIISAVGYVRACADLRGKNTNLVKYLREVALAEGIRKEDTIGKYDPDDEEDEED